MRQALRAVFSLALTIGCEGNPPVLRLLSASEGDGLRLTLQSASGTHINARLKPVLEMRNGTLLRFDSPYLTPDSSYFAAPPEALLPRARGPVHGRLRASVCDQDERTCRVVTLQL